MSKKKKSYLTSEDLHLDSNEKYTMLKQCEDLLSEDVVKDIKKTNSNNQPLINQKEILLNKINEVIKQLCVNTEGLDDKYDCTVKSDFTDDSSCEILISFNRKDDKEDIK